MKIKAEKCSCGREPRAVTIGGKLADHVYVFIRCPSCRKIATGEGEDAAIKKWNELVKNV